MFCMSKIHDILILQSMFYNLIFRNLYFKNQHASPFYKTLIKLWLDLFRHHLPEQLLFFLWAGGRIVSTLQNQPYSVGTLWVWTHFIQPALSDCNSQNHEYIHTTQSQI